MKRILEQPKLKLKVDFKELKKYLSIPMINEDLKKDDIVELIDEKLGINRKCKVVEVRLLKDYLQAIVLTEV